MTDTLTEAPATRPRRRRGRVAPVLAIVLLVALAFTVSGVFPFRQLIQQRRQIEATQQHLEQLTEQNEQLAADLAALDTDAEIERIAREQYGLVRPGETAYIVVQPTPGDATEDATEEPDVVETERSWWERVWLFVTGGDVDGDG